jgi:hypothetical protein
VRQTLDILLDVNDLLQVLVLAVVEYRIIDDDAVYAVVLVGSNDRLFDIIFGDVSDAVLEATRPSSQFSLMTLLL